MLKNKVSLYYKMSGGIAQLVAVGAQDAHLVGAPEVSFFRSTYKRHTNFSQTVERQVIQGNVSNGGMSTVRFERKGDLLNYVYLAPHDSTGPDTEPIPDWTAVISKVELLIGGQVVDTQDSTYSTLIAPTLSATSSSKSVAAGLYDGAGTSKFYPLRFSFCENWQSALPLVALQYHDVEIKIHWSANLNVNRTYHVNASFIMLDEEERNHIAFNQHDILIYQVQKNIPSQKNIHELVFNHPVKFIASSNASSTNNLVSRTNEVKLQINGTDVEDFKTGVPYFTAIPSYYHTDYSGSNSENLFLHSFCLSANKYQPTGTLNFSRIDSCTLHCTQPIDRTIYAVNYNILRIKDGMAGILYAD